MSSSADPAGNGWGNGEGGKKMEEPPRVIRVLCESGLGEEAEGTVPADTDLTDRFTLTLDDGSRVRVCGWAGYVEVIA